MRNTLMFLLAFGLVVSACGDDATVTTVDPAPTASVAVATTTIGTTTSTSTTSTSTTTLAPTTTLPLEQRDALLGASLWQGVTEAWVEGPEAAARFISDNTWPGRPAAYADCLRPEAPTEWGTYLADLDTVDADPDWQPPGAAMEVEGRIYSVGLSTLEGGESGYRKVHFTVLDDGVAYFFWICEPPLAEDALAYRLEEGASYTHKVTYRADITEDQRLAGGRRATGRETWTQYRSFEVTSIGGSGARVEMAMDRIIWEMFSAGVHRNAFDTDDDPNDPYGLQGDLVGESYRWTVDATGPGINRQSSRSFLTLPGIAVAEGDTWESRWALNDPSLSGDMTVTVTSVTEDEVRVSLEGTGTGRATVALTARPDYELVTEGTITGTAVIDRATGWIRTMDVAIAGEGTTKVTSGGFWSGIRPLAGSSTLDIGLEMPTTYTIRIETRTIEG